MFCVFKKIPRFKTEAVRTCSQTALTTNNEYRIVDTRSLPSEDDFRQIEQKSVLEECTEDISHVAPYLKPTFNFAAYVNKSVTLQELLKLGVDLHKLEKKITYPPYIIGLDFENDVKNHVVFLHELGLPIEDVGALITKNPFIFKQSLEDLRVRIDFLYSKKFTKDMVVRIVSRNPFWLMFTTQRIDRRLGYFQKEFKLTGNEVRQLATQQPKLVTYSMAKIKVNTFTIREEMGFDFDETKAMLLKQPKLFMQGQDKILNTFDFVHNKMKVPLETITKTPDILTHRAFRIKQRFLFLEKLGKTQFNPKQPNYVSLLSIVTGSDSEFCTEVAKSSIQAFNTFLKTL